MKIFPSEVALSNCSILSKYLQREVDNRPLSEEENTMKSLKKKILLRSISIIAATLLLLTAFLVFMSYKNTLTTLDKTMKETTTIAALQIQTRIEATESILAEIGTLARLSNDTISFEEKKSILNMKRDTYEFKSVSLALSDGMDLDGNNISDRDFFAASMKGERFVTDPLVTADGKSAEFIISAPLWDKGYSNTTVVGVVYAVVDGEFLSTIVDNIKIGETGAAYIINANSTIIAHVNRDLVYTMYNPVKAAEQDQSLKALSDLAKKVISGETVFGKYTFNDVTKFAVFSPINHSNGWSLGVNVEYNEYMQQTTNTIIFAVIFSVAALLISSLFNIKIANSITKPVLEISMASEQLAQGDLTVAITHKGNDELGKLADSFNATIISLNSYIHDIAEACREISEGNFDTSPSANFKGAFIEIATSINVIIDNLSNTMKQIGITAEQVHIGADQVSTGSQSLAQGAAEQASSAEELSATIQDITVHIKNNAENADLASQKANQAGEQIQSSHAFMMDLKKAMDEISSKSGEISRIVKTIDDIAFQTNILALNAAVEAARAGSAGKGFAVVADEVRNLASKSAEAAKNTTALIDETLTAISRGTGIADQTADALDESVEATNHAIGLINEIALASKVQADSVSQISIGVEQISSVTQNNSAFSEESAAASEELTAQAKELTQLISHFKLREN
jgi:methyl-accepting chemotaxis protein